MGLVFYRVGVGAEEAREGGRRGEKSRDLSIIYYLFTVFFDWGQPLDHFLQLPVLVLLGAQSSEQFKH